MRKRNLFSTSNRLANSNRRRTLLKRVHKKIQMRQQQFSVLEELEPFAHAC